MECLKTLRLSVLSEAGVRLMACPHAVGNAFDAFVHPISTRVEHQAETLVGRLTLRR